MRNFESTVAAAFISIAVVGCAATPGLEAESDALASAKSCCASDNTLPNPEPLESGKLLVLDHSAPHFDFGRGLAPFVHVALGARHIVGIELVSRIKPSARMAGGDGGLYAPTVVVDFVMADSSRVRGRMSDPVNVLAGAASFYSVSRYAVIPSGAVSAYISTSPRDFASTYRGCARPGGSGNPIAMGACVTYPAGVVNFGYRVVGYGTVTVHLLEAGSKVALSSSFTSLLSRDSD